MRVWVSVHSLCAGEHYMLHYKCIFITSSYIIYSAYSLCTGEHWHASCERQCTCSSRLWEIQNQTVWENFEYIHICTITSPQETQTWKPSYHIKYKYLLTSNTNTFSQRRGLCGEWHTPLCCWLCVWNFNMVCVNFVKYSNNYKETLCLPYLHQHFVLLRIIKVKMFPLSIYKSFRIFFEYFKYQIYQYFKIFSLTCLL